MNITTNLRMTSTLAPNRHVFQGVHMLLQFSKNGSWKEGQTRVNKLVFIGKNLDREELTSKFKACLV